MDGAKEQIDNLYNAGSSFDFENFSYKNYRGMPNSYTPAWIGWKARVNSTISRLFDSKSAAMKMLQAAERKYPLGEGPQIFEQTKTYYMSALSAASEALEADTFREVTQNTDTATAPLAYTNKVFVVHGHDEVAKQELEILLTEMGLEPVVLHRQPDGGRTIIEKFEHYADVGYAFVLMTPDEIAYLVSENEKPDTDRVKEQRSRPNVIFEFGFFVGRLGRGRTCCLYRGDVAIPSDLSGLIYKRFERSVEETAWSVSKELKAAGYSLK
ncbi:TIR domain-containing protein [Methylobacterium sp. Leaf99]|uniref:TIR domain-containing protein n=1 Tax=Methylobacterium sp. Leaf99 TaxID=1736251 RepID=UPI000AF2DC64|nr:nucleotide-binding protein [Methylobacterium sp. Leaf99]